MVYVGLSFNERFLQGQGIGERDVSKICGNIFAYRSNDVRSPRRSNDRRAGLL